MRNKPKPRQAITSVTTSAHKTPVCKNASDLVLRRLFDVHVFEFAGLEHFATFLALHKLRLLVTAYDLHARVLARRLHITAWSRSGRLGGHKSGSLSKRRNAGGCFAGISRYFRLALAVVKPPLLRCRKFVTRFPVPPPILLELSFPQISAKNQCPPISHSVPNTYRSIQFSVTFLRPLALTGISDVE